MANAGPDLTVGKGTTVRFNGSASSDNVGIANYTWTFLHDGNPVSLHGATPEFRFRKEGNHTVTLTVTDAGGNTDFDTMTVTVEPVDDGKGTIIDGDRRIMIIPIAILFIVILGVFLVRRTPKRLDKRDLRDTQGTRGARDRQGTRDALAPFPSTSPHPGGPSPDGSPVSPATHSFAPVLTDPAFDHPSQENAPHPPTSAGVWFCAKCGTKLEDKYVFCLECGNRRRR